MKKKYSSSFKAKVVLAAIKENCTMAELSSKYEVHRIQIQNWKKIGVENFHTVFGKNQVKADQEKENLIKRLYEQIGQLKVEADW